MLLGCCGALVAASHAACSATDSTASKQQTTSTPKGTCVPVLNTKPKPSWPKSLTTQKGESFKGNPVISFDVDEEGNVKDAKVVRSSGIRDVDEWVLREMKRWKYKPAPSCGLRHSQVIVTIDLTSSRID
jgi:TonB family protein